MSIQKEYIGSRGTAYIRTYSDIPGYGVMRDGVIYMEAVDPAILHREYTEVSLELPPEEVNNDQVTIQDYSQTT